MTASEAPSAAQRRVFALLIDSLDDEHEVAVVRGATAAADEIGATILCVPGGPIGHPGPGQSAKNFVFELIGPDSVQGVLALTSAIGNAAEPERLSRFIERFRPLRTCCIGVGVRGHPSVGVDNSTGFRELVTHLIRAHGKRRIVCVRGPSASVEAEQRFSAYLDTLADHGLEADPRLVVEGDFSKQSGVEAVRTLLDERRVSPAAVDALAAANDYMAIGALDELLARGIQVPDQIAVVGFDDVESARGVLPALTTVRQPEQALGRVAVLKLDEPETEEHETLRTELVIRSSCGCAEADAGLAARTNLPSRALGIEAAFMQRRQIIVAEMARAARGGFMSAGSGWESRLLDALVSEIRGDVTRPLTRILAQALRRIERARADARPMQDVLTALRSQSLSCVEGDAAARDRFEDALHAARIALGAVLAQAAANRARESIEHLKRLTRPARSLLVADEGQMASAAQAWLEPLGIELCFVAEFDSYATDSARVRVLFGIGREADSLAHRVFSVRTLLAQALVRPGRRAFFLLPLVSGTAPSGVAILSAAEVDGDTLEELRLTFEAVVGLASLRRARG